jgi:hypothetical protein
LHSLLLHPLCCIHSAASILLHSLLLHPLLLHSLKSVFTAAAFTSLAAGAASCDDGAALKLHLMLEL